MKRDPDTDAPHLFAFARDYLHSYLPKARGLSRNRSRPTGSAWSASLAT
jgi:hypothetical protein